MSQSAMLSGSGHPTLLERERRVLGQIASGVPLAQVLDELLHAVEAQSDHTMLTSILLLSEDGRHLIHGAAPSLPAAYNETIDGIQIGEGVGSCGTVASRGTPVYAVDIATDPIWRDFRDLALSHNLRACWSTPIRAVDGAFIGTFAIYYNAPRSPTPADIEAIAFVTQTAALAIDLHRQNLRIRRTQEELQAQIAASGENQDRLTNAIDIARLGTFVWNATTGTVELDARSRLIFGLPPEMAVRQEDIFTRIDPDEFERVLAQAQAGVETGRRVEVDYPIIRPNGSRRVVRSLGDLVINEAGDRCMRGVFHDITLEKEIEATLRTEKQNLQRQVARTTQDRDRAWRMSQELLVVALPDGTIESVNPTWTQLLGWEEHEIVGRPFVEFTHPDDLDATLVAFAGIFEKSLVIPFEYRFRHRDGSYRWFGWTGAFEEGKVYASGRQLTVEKEQAEALRQSQKMEAVGQLTGGLAHDFNNLLAVISGSLELLERRVMQGRIGEIERFVVSAQSAAKRATALTHRLLAFSRRQTLDPRPTAVNQLIAGMDDLLRRTVGPAIAVETVGAAGLWNTLIDSSQLENALLNLCINARDAMPDGGRMTIETANRWVDDRAAKARDVPPGQYVSLSVSDTGTGMPPDVIAKAFDPFFTTKPIGQGTGLGLSMIYGFARQSGGQVRIYSEVGQGTTITVYLPRHYGEADGTDEAAQPEPETALEGETVLVVDDEPGVRMLVAEVLSELGYAIIEAEDGPSALKVVSSKARIDLLVTDVGLPGGMNGRQVADAARVARPGLKVLFITGYAENAVVGNGHLEPGMAVITKPFAVDALANRIKDLIAQAPAARRA